MANKSIKKVYGGAIFCSSFLEFWSFGVLEFWSFGVLEFWSFGVFEFWFLLGTSQVETQWKVDRYRGQKNRALYKYCLGHLFAGVSSPFIYSTAESF